MRGIAATVVLLVSSLQAVHADGPKPTMLDPTLTQVTAGISHTCALTTTGAVKCWGLNSSGQLGNGTTTNSFAPVTVANLTDVVGIVAGDSHTCAWTTQGWGRCWGINDKGQLGDATYANKSTPVATIDLGNTASMAAGFGHTCALTAAGTVMCWGSNTYGQLGDGTTVSKNVPGAVSGLGSDVVAIATGTFHTCALTKAGAVKCWGNNTNGRLGDGTVVDKTTPVAVSGMGSGIAAIAAAGRHTCALSRGGTVKCWGYNGDGELGDGTFTTSSTPVAVSGLNGVAAIATHGYHTCALATAATVKCWGQNATGQLGDGSKNGSPTPVAVSGLSDVAAVVTGGYHTCARDSLGSVKCWGYNPNGQVGDGSVVDRSVPVIVPAFGSVPTAIATGLAHTCARTVAGAPRCWGANISGQLGDGTTVDRMSPDGINGLPSGVAALAAGGNSCALTNSGGVVCWGDGNTTPVSVTGLTSGVAAVATAVSAGHHCAITTAGAMKCWGTNDFGQLGDGTTVAATTPVSVSGLGSGVAAMSLGDEHTCAITTAGAVKCWGRNNGGQLGDGSLVDKTTPVTVTGMASGFSGIAAGSLHSCALSTTGGVKCWGIDPYGQLGDGGINRSTTPLQVVGLTSGVAAITAGGDHTCARTTAGGATCWGQNVFGQVGDGTLVDRNMPVPVSGLTAGVVAIDAGGVHTCALTDAAVVMCWGNGEFGQLGTVVFNGRAKTPQTVLVGRTIALEPFARVRAGTTADFTSLFVSADYGASLDSWTSNTCSVSNNVVTFTQAGLCGLRISALADPRNNFALPPRQLRLIQVEDDLVFASGLEVWGGMKH